MIYPVTLDEIEQALQLPDFDVHAAHRLLSPLSRAIVRPPELGGEARLGGVMLLLFPGDEELHLVLTRRRSDLAAHPGQISFPGGRNEAEETLEITALRETEEEIGVPAAAVQIIGALAPIYIPPSDFHVYPYVGWTHNGQRPSFVPAPEEVAEIIEVPLSSLLAPDARAEETWELHGRKTQVPHFAVAGHKVWGATGIMLSEFVERLRVVTGGQGQDESAT